MAGPDAAEQALSLSAVFHDAAIAVDETGTDAAAATGAVLSAVAAPQDPFEFVADRPFLFAIRDRPTDAILFLGRVLDADGARRDGRNA